MNNRHRLLEQAEDQKDTEKADEIMERVAKGKEKIYPEVKTMKLFK